MSFRRDVEVHVPRPIVAALVLAVILWLTLLAWYLLEGLDGSDWLYLTVMFLVPVIIGARAFAGGDRGDSTVWIMLAGATLLSACGDLIYVWETAGQDAEPFPSLADVTYLAYYPFAIAGIALYVRRRARRVPTDIAVDAAMIAIATASLVGAILLGPVSVSLEGGAWAAAIGAAYPVGNTVVMLIAVLGVALIGARSSVSLMVIAAAMVVSEIADVHYFNAVASGTYVEGGWTDAMWPLSGLLLAVAAWTPQPVTKAAAGPRRGLLVAPRAALVLGASTLTLAIFHDVSPLVVAMALTAIGGVLYRLSGTVRRTRMLLDAQRAAATDELTGILNRRGFIADVDAVLGAVARGASTALMHADLDGFKEVNDSLGHDAGDLVLQEVTARLTEALEGQDIILGRLGGDEFAVLVVAGDRAKASEIAVRMRAALVRPVSVGGTKVTLGISIGIALAPEDGTDTASLLKRADIAMYRAKVNRLGAAVFDPSIDLGEAGHLQRIEELRRGIDAGELTLHFQPKISLDTGEVVAAEALMRWRREGGQVVNPADFLGLASQAGLMGLVSAKALELAGAQASRWRDAGIELPIAVNVSGVVFAGHELPVHVGKVLAAHKLPGSALRIEIAEHALLKGRVRARSILARLDATDVKTAINAFGTGYSSLSYLQDLRLDEVKIDRSFIVPMATDERAAAVVASTVGLVHALGFTATAVGVEDGVAEEMLVRMGCDDAQGVRWSGPLPADEFTSWLSGQRIDADAVH